MHPFSALSSVSGTMRYLRQASPRGNRLIVEGVPDDDGIAVQLHALMHARSLCSDYSSYSGRLPVFQRSHRGVGEPYSGKTPGSSRENPMAVPVAWRLSPAGPLSNQHGYPRATQSYLVFTSRSRCRVHVHVIWLVLLPVGAVSPLQLPLTAKLPPSVITAKVGCQRIP